MTPDQVVELAVGLVRLLVALVGHEKASELLSQEAINRANAAADAVEASRGLE